MSTGSLVKIGRIVTMMNRRVGVMDGVKVGVGVSVGVGVGVDVGVLVGFGVRVGFGVEVGIGVELSLAPDVSVDVAVRSVGVGGEESASNVDVACSLAGTVAGKVVAD